MELEKMKIRLNGEDKEVHLNLNIYELLIDLELNPCQSGIAVAVDQEVIPKTKWKETKLLENSEVEIIRAVQGG
jgi:sulfur carrier protein